MTTFTLPKPYLLFLGEVTDPRYAKTAFGLKDWATSDCVGEWALNDSTLTTGLPRMTPSEAAARGAASVVIGVAPAGGQLEKTWIEPMIDALNAGLDIVSGMHSMLEDNDHIAQTAKLLGRRLINVRRPDPLTVVGTGQKRQGQRLLTVGTDCALGKKYTALALARELGRRGIRCDFRATGQTGIMIAGSGVPLDAVVADFISGYAEALSPNAPAEHWDVIEGQGSLFHPAFAGVTLGLLHGSQPDVLVLCHEPGRDRLLGAESFPSPTLNAAIEAYLNAARLTNRAARFAGISLNTSKLGDAAARVALTAATNETGLPAADPIRGFGLDALVDACLITVATFAAHE
jgi:uncharacterized NAD-dependent epimerase/dehydratase family protein